MILPEPAARRDLANVSCKRIIDSKESTNQVISHARLPPRTRLHPDLPALARIETPALIIDEVAMQSNIERMATTASARKAALRPHAKTHKSAAIALRQLKAGAIGIAGATLLEAQALAEAGVTGLLVTSPVVGADKAA